MLILSIIIFILVYFYFTYYQNNTTKYIPKLNQCFYDYKKIYPELSLLKGNNNLILKEIQQIETQWNKWPEQYLYQKNMQWDIIPFLGFGKFIDENIKRYPHTYSLISKINGVQTALLSKLGQKTILNKHQGWGQLSNRVLRVHYGIDVPENCFIGVENEKEKLETDKIVVFDDSKEHWAENNSNKSRIVLILDIERPSYIENGVAPMHYSEELIKYINKFS